MLRINRTVATDVVRLDLEGRLVGMWVRQLEDCWQDAKSVQLDRALHVNLAAVTFIDHTGQCLLKRMYQEGVQLCAAGSLNEYVISDIRRSATSSQKPE